MKKFLFLFSFFLLAVSNLYAGEKTITISRNDVAWESANTVYNVTKGGVELVMSGGMNNPNFLLMKQHTTITVKSHNFNIKRIVFHCLDNYTNDNLDVFYWGPTTLSIQYSQTHAERAGTLTQNYQGSTYDALWVSTKSSSPGNYPNGLPAGYELMFENQGKPVRFASIDIVVEQEVGDIYELVTSQSEVQASTSSNKVTYMLVGRANANTTQGYALSVNTTGSTVNDDIKSTPVTLLDNGLRVKANEETQFITLESTGNSSYPYYVKAGSNYIRTQSSLVEATGRRGYHLTKVANKPSEDYIRTKVTINSDAGTNNWGNFAAIKYQGSSFGDYAIRHIGQYTNDNGTTDYYQFRNLYDQAYSDRRVYLYKPAQQYKVTTEVIPEYSYGTISLRDGVLVDNGTNWSQKMETVQFLVTPANGYKVKTITIQELNSSGNVVGTVDITTSAPSINGTLYTFEMPGNDVNIIVEFEEVVYHNINIVVNPSGDYGNVFLTEGYVVQNDQVKSYDGENVVFNVTPNPIDIEHEENGYHELYSVTVTYTEGGQTISYTYTDGNYNFTMPDADVTITATFIYENGNPLYLLGSANGKEFLPYGPRFNFDSTNQEYYIDVYFKGTNEYGGNNDNAYGYFCLSWGKWTTWDEVNQQTRRAQPWDNNYLISTENPQYTLCYDDNKQNAFKIPAGIYRIKVKSYGYHNDVLSIERNYPTLSFDPTGGENAENAVQADPGTVVTLEGDLYNKIMAINPDEPAANFKYKATKTIGENTTADEPVASTTTATTTLTEVNEGETVTELHGYNYLGWIVAGDTAFYKVINTPLSWIEENGVPGKNYTVADRLLIVWTPEEHADNPCADYGKTFWAKDLPTTEKPGGLSIDATYPEEGQVDYMMLNEYTARPDGWDQSNWIELDLSDVPDHGAAIGKYIAAGTLKGEYTSDLNYKMKVTSLEFTDEEDEYVPNTFCTANFLENNLMLTPESTGPQGPSEKYYFFLNPKVQEYARITYAKWDKDNQEFVVPSFGNAGEFSGALKIGGWDYNIKTGEEVIAALDNNASDPNVDPNLEYEFRAIIHRENYNYGHNPNASVGTREQQSSNNITVWPIDLQATSNVITTVNDVNVSKAVSSVKYYNIMGVESNKPFCGVNIVVTRYSDGTISTTKVLR